MSTDQLERVDRYLEAYARRDRAAMAEHFDDSIVWHVAGAHALSGDYRGREDVLDYLARAQYLAEGSLNLAPIEVLSSDDHLVMFVRVRGGRDGHYLDVELVEVFRIGPGGRWSEFWSMADDQAQVDAFWSGIARDDEEA
ncbi:MAG: nuclear transport factor 2 family protein [Acidimicrobiales bacterium]